MFLIKPLQPLWLSIIVFAFLLSGCDSSKPHEALPNNATVLALGDSLTYGYGATPDSAYPQRLAKATGWRVINAGINGNTSEQALARLDELLDEHNPDMVIVSIGGNDFLQRLPDSQAEANIRHIIDDIKRHGNAEILLVGIPHYSLGAALGNPSDHPFYQKIADSENVTLLSDAWSDVIGNRSLRSDQVHPNAQGYEQFTNTLLDFLRQQGWL